MEVTLSKNGWHRKLQTFVFPNAPMYNSLCPYFWLTVFCFLITVPFPIVPIIKLVVGFFMLIWWLIKKLLKSCNDYFCKPLLDYVARKLPEPEIIKGYTAYQWEYTSSWHYDEKEYNEFSFWHNQFPDREIEWSRRAKKNRAKFEAWKEQNPDWKERIAEIRMRQRAEFEKLREERIQREIKEEAEEIARIRLARERNEKKEAKRKAQIARTQKFFTFIVKYTKWLAWVFMAAVIAVLAYFLFQGVMWLFHFIDRVHWDRVWHWTKFTLEWLVVVATGIMLIIFLFKLIRKCVISMGDFPRMHRFGKWIGRGLDRFADWAGPKLTKVVKAIVYVAKGIGSVFSFLWMYAVATKKNYCPAINWKEDQKNTAGE